MTRRIGVIYPSNGVYEAEFTRFAPDDITLHFTRLLWPDSEWFHHDWPGRMSLLATDSDITACAARFEPIAPAVVTYACTSVSFARGAGGDMPVLDTIARGTTARPSSTSTAFAAACAAMGTRRVAIASVYRSELSERFGEFLAAEGIATCSVRSAGWDRQPDDDHRLTTADVARMAIDCDHDEAQAVLIPETNILTTEAVSLLEARLGKPVVTAIQATVWHAARLAGSTQTDGIGSLWSHTLPGAETS